MKNPTHKSPVKFLIFDFDGTLADSLTWLARIMPEAAARYRFRSIGSEKENWLRSLDSHELVEYLRIPAWKIPLVANYLRRRMAKDIHEIRLYPGIESLLLQLASGPLKLGILSSNSKNNVQHVLGDHLSSLFHYYECGIPLLGKTRQLKNVLSKSGFRAVDSFFIGDEIRDLEAAKKEGVRFGAVTWGFNNETAFQQHQPNEIFHSVSEISDLIANHNLYPSPDLPIHHN